MVYTRCSVSALEGGTHTCTEREVNNNKLLYVDSTASLLYSLRDGSSHSFSKYVLSSPAVSRPVTWRSVWDENELGVRASFPKGDAWKSRYRTVNQPHKLHTL